MSKLPDRINKPMSPDNEKKHNHYVDSAIIWVTLGTLFIIPIIFNYFRVVSVFAELKLVTLHLGAGVILILWMWELIVTRQTSIGIPRQDIHRRLKIWVGRNPANWALIGAFVWFTALVMSTLLSPLLSISFFGAEDNRSGYSLYDYISLFIIFLSIAIRFRSIALLRLLIYTLISSGTIVAAYGIAQHFGWDPLAGNFGLNRVQASFENPIGFGAYMVMAIPATLALAGTARKHTWASLTIILVGLQLAGLWFSGSRGPYIATFTGLITFFVLAVALGHIKWITRYALILIGSALFAGIIITVPSEQNEIGIERILSIENQITDSEAGSNELSGGLGGRSNIWNSTFELTKKWNVPAEEPSVNALLRPIFGLGPDMFIYSFPIVSNPRAGIQVVDHAHNYELQVLMEQGFIGLFGFTMLSGFLILSAFTTAKHIRSSNYRINTLAILGLALFPPMIGRMVEIQSGVARVSDLAMMFALFGAVIALHKVTIHQQISNNKKSLTNHKSHHSLFLAWRIVAIGVVATILITIFIGWDIRRLSSSRHHANGLAHTSSFDQVQAWAKAQSQAPERPLFTTGLFTEYFHGAIYLHSQGAEEDALRLMLTGRELLLEFEKLDPFRRDTQFNLLHTEVALFQWGYVEYVQQAVDRSQKIIKLYPSYPSLLSIMATDMAVIGVNELAIEYADRAIDVEDVTQPWSKAWYAKGRALYQLGQTQEAITILTTATEKRPGAEGAVFAHKLLAKIFGEEGQSKNPNLSEFHKQKGDAAVTVQE